MQVADSILIQPLWILWTLPITIGPPQSFGSIPIDKSALFFWENGLVFIPIFIIGVVVGVVFKLSGRANEQMHKPSHQESSKPDVVLNGYIRCAHCQHVQSSGRQDCSQCGTHLAFGIPIETGRRK